MRGYTHWLTGLAFGVAAAPAILGHAPDPAELAVVALVTAGGSFAPDIDHHSATIAHTFGWPTQLLTRWVGRATQGHRGLTHTLPGAAAFGAVAWLLELFGATVGRQLAVHAGAGPGIVHVAASVGQYLAVICCLGLSVGALGLTRSKDALTSLATFAGCAVFVSVTAAAGVGYEWVPAAVVVGCLAHLAGDVCTEQGVMIAWPFTRHRFRVGTIDTGKRVELLVVAPALTVMLALVVIYRLGYWPQLWSAAQTIA
jgi:membrane-bound metal-dependent hydrolase YbcI (DUF457 family)